jgi:hypothetical protein
MLEIMWPVCGCNCMRYIKNVWASQDVWGLQGPQVLTFPIAFMAPSMFLRKCVRVVWFDCSIQGLKGYPEVLRVNLVRHAGSTSAPQTSWEHYRAVSLTLHHRWTDHTGDDYCKCLLKRLDILSCMQAHFAIVCAVCGPIFLHVAGVIHVKESIVQVIGYLFNLTHPFVYGYQVASCSYVFVTNHGDCMCEYISDIVACV